MRGSRKVGRSFRTSPKAGGPLCPATGKIRYRDGHDAALALKALVRRRSRAECDGATCAIRVCRKYPCESCGGWHLTSRPRAQWAAA